MNHIPDQEDPISTPWQIAGWAIVIALSFISACAVIGGVAYLWSR